MNYYRSQNLYDSNLYYDQRNQQQMQLNRQNQKLQIHYDMLGKVLQSAENFAMIANNRHSKKNFKYYDSFNNAESKGVDQARTEFISSMEFFQCALNRYKKNYNSFELPKDIDVIKNIREWKNYFPAENQSDRKLFDDFEKIVTGKMIGNYDAGNYFEYNDPRSNEAKANFWGYQGTRITESVDRRHKEIEDKFANNPNEKPKLYVGYDRPGNDYLEKGYKNFSNYDNLFKELEEIYQNALNLFDNRNYLYSKGKFNSTYEKNLKQLKEFESKYYNSKNVNFNLPQDKNYKIGTLKNCIYSLKLNNFFINYIDLFQKIINIYSDN